MGLFLGCVSILMGLIPNGIRQFTGLTVIGNHVGYLLAALIVAWLYSERWVKGALLSGGMLVTANVIYYAFVFAFNAFGVQSESHLSNLFGLLAWSVIGLVIGLLAATAVWLARKAKSKILNYGIFGIAYLGMMGVIYVFQVRFVLALYRFSTFDSASSRRQFAGSIFEVGFAVLITTAVLGIGFKHIINDAKQRAGRADFCADSQL